VDSIGEPSANGKEMNGGQVISGEFVEALRETSHIFKTAKEPLNNIAFSIETLVVTLGTFRV